VLVPQERHLENQDGFFFGDVSESLLYSGAKVERESRHRLKVFSPPSPARAPAIIVENRSQVDIRNSPAMFTKISPLGQEKGQRHPTFEKSAPRLISEFPAAELQGQY